MLTLMESKAVRGVSFVDTQNGWAVGWAASGNVHESGIVYSTADGGDTWSNVAKVKDELFNDVDFTDVDHGWAISATGIFFSDDQGETWSLQWTLEGGQLSSVAFDQLTGWAVGNKDVLATIDGGATWSLQETGQLYAGDDGLVRSVFTLPMQ